MLKKIVKKVFAFTAVSFMIIAFIIPVLPIRADESSDNEINKDIILRVGDNMMLSAAGIDNAAVWSSSNSEIAEVTKEGKVKAEKPGTAKITAVVNGITYTCKVTVADTYTWRFNKHTYQLIETGMNWSAAEKYCESLGGHLAVITTAKEHASVANAIKKHANKNNYWLGAEKDSSGEFTWITGEDFSYRIFAVDQPDNQSEKYLMIYAFDNPITGSNDKYRWNDISNDGTFGSESWFGLSNFGIICEWN